MTSKYLRENKKIILKIIEKIIKKDLKDCQYLEDFITNFYSNVSLDDISDLSYSDLYAIARNLTLFIANRKGSTPKIRIYTPNESQHGWKSENTVIEILNKDMPFLVDSTTAVLRKFKMEIRQIIHPIFNVVRRKNGNIEELTAFTGERDEDQVAESLIHFQVNKITDDKDIAKLKEELLYTLELVKFAVVDWRVMLERLSMKETRLSSLYDIFDTNYIDEVRSFLGWLGDNNFTFLGMIEYSFEKDKIVINENTALGIFRHKKYTKEYGLEELPPEIRALTKDTALIEITKTDNISFVHRPVHMDCIDVKRFDTKGKILGGLRIIGLFTSIVYYQSANSIPLIRKKITNVIKRSGFTYSGHSGKEIPAIIDSFPRDELLQISEDELLNTCMGIMTLSLKPRTKLFIRQDIFQKFVSCIVFVPKERFATHIRERIQELLSKKFNGVVLNHYTQITDSPLARVQIIIKIKDRKPVKYDLHTLEEDITEITSNWGDDVYEGLKERLGISQAEALHLKYVDAFPGSYKEVFSPKTSAIDDIEIIEKVIKNKSIEFAIYYAPKSEHTDTLRLKIYSYEERQMLSSMMPVLENLGVDVIDHHSYKIKFAHTISEDKKKVYLHYFRLTSAEINEGKLELVKPIFEETLRKIWSNQVENDCFNALVLRAGLNYREIMILRGYSRYLQQIGFSYSQNYIEEVLVKHSDITKELVNLFIVRFCPKLKQKRNDNVQNIQNKINNKLISVSNIAEDKVLRRFLALILATIRTNFFQIDGGCEPKSYISYKFSSKKVPHLPLPHPYAEIFVYSGRFEAIHLRGGPVARGGLRWSDRREDFRTEILGLVKAQMTKNSVIVPVGSKGGFVVKANREELGPDDYLQEGIKCYKNFLRGLLDITDNIVNEKVKTPKDVVRYDDDDPYLVVAADKGTATFSDYANGISREYNFWLGDAFASGGSAGYDHKKKWGLLQGVLGYQCRGISGKCLWIYTRRTLQ